VLLSEAYEIRDGSESIPLRLFLSIQNLQEFFILVMKGEIEMDTMIALGGG
jgi:hypothetical protein